MSEILQTKTVYYDILWDKVKTIKDIKKILQILASKVVIDHNNLEDVAVYNILKNMLSKSDDQSNI